MGAAGQAKADLARTWMGRLVRLNPATGRGNCAGKAPHKPLLLLALIDMAERGELLQRSFTRSAGLVLRFKSYGSLVTDRWPTRLDIAMPFYHLKSQGFWAAFTADMKPATSPETCALCELDSGFFELLADADFRLKTRMLLVATYFSKTEQVALFAGLGIETRTGRATPDLRDLSREAAEAAKRKGRSARFAVQVVSGYRYTCALTGLSCMTCEGAAIVDAAHIDPWSKSRNDDPANGLALSKNAHWTFDEGLWTVDRTGRILVNTSRFTENGPDQLRLATYSGRLLQFAPSVTLRPLAENLRRHREAHGFAEAGCSRR